MSENVNDVHSSVYSTLPNVVVNAPCRIHLVGEHCYFFEDKTLSLAADFPVSVAASKRDDAFLYFYFSQLNEKKSVNLLNMKYKREDHWANMFKAVVFAFQSLDYNVSGVNFTLSSKILPSSGLGILPSVLVACALALKKLYEFEISDTELLEIFEIACNEFLKTPFRLADFYTVLYGKKGNFVLTDYATEKYQYVPFDFENTKWLLTDANVSKIPVWNVSSICTEKNRILLSELKRKRNGVVFYETSSSEIREVFEDCSEEEIRHLTFIMKEYQLLQDCLKSISEKSAVKFAKCINRSHELLGSLFQDTCPEVDWLAKRVLEIEKETSCARVTGSGAGRCIYSVLKNENVENYVQKLVDYERIFGFHPDFHVIETSDGAAFQNDK